MPTGYGLRNTCAGSAAGPIKAAAAERERIHRPSREHPLKHGLNIAGHVVSLDLVNHGQAPSRRATLHTLHRPIVTPPRNTDAEPRPPRVRLDEPNRLDLGPS